MNQNMKYGLSLYILKLCVMMTQSVYVCFVPCCSLLVCWLKLTCVKCKIYSLIIKEELKMYSYIWY